MKNKNKQKPKILVVMIILALVVVLTLTIYIFVRPKYASFVNGELINENFTFLLDGNASEVNSYDVFKDQNTITDELLNNYKKGKYSINNPYVVLNPYKISPLSALVMFKTTKSERVTVTLKGKHNDDIVTTFEAGKDHYIPIYGLYSNYQNIIIITTESGKSNTITIETKEINSPSKVEVISNNITNANGGFYFSTSTKDSTVAYDNYGEIRFYLTTCFSKGISMLQNGHMLISNDSVGPNINSTSGMVEIDMLGYIHREYELDGGYHHDAIEMENGDLVVLTNDNNNLSIEDTIIVLDSETGKTKRMISLYKIIFEIDPNLFGDSDIAGMNLNGIYYDKSTNELVLSMRNRNSVIALDYDSLEIKWILGDSQFWSDKFSKYMLNGVGANFMYPLGQHSPIINRDGNLSIFNNGYNAYNEKSIPCSSLKNSASYALEYKIDRLNKTAEVIYQFGGHQYFSYTLSSYNYTYDGHSLFNSGWHFSNESIYDDPACTQFNNDKYHSYIIEFDENNHPLVELKVGKSMFEVVKAHIYNLEYSSVKPKKLKEIPNYVFNKSASFLTNKERSNYETLSESDAITYQNSEVLPISFELINKQFSLIGTVPEYLDFKVTFISTRGNAYRFTLKEVNEYLTSSVDLSSLPNGRYYIYVNMGDQVYNTREYLDLN